MKIAVIGNYLPRECGIATFTHNFVMSVQTAFAESDDFNEIFVVAMNNKGQTYDYPSLVKYRIRQDYPKDYLCAAKFINKSGADVCVLQHEYGIYGGESGVLILSLIQNLKMPLVVICHTVLKRPTFHEKAILSKIGQRAHKVIVMSNLAIEFLQTIFGIPLHKVMKIHHGVPDFGSNSQSKSTTDELFPGKTILCTFGLLGRNKGIETVIHSLPEVVAKHPEVLYLVLGKTHPMVRKNSGEEYRDYLKNLAGKKGVSQHVHFIDEFLGESELKTYLRRVNLYITPYLNEAQITSGTLAYAIGAGTCVLSTPYWHAKELLADGRGQLFPFGDSQRLTLLMNELLDNPDKMGKIRFSAFEYGKTMYWKSIGKKYLAMMQSLDDKPVPGVDDTDYDFDKAPAFSLDHVKRLTDYTGIIEHAIYTVAKFNEGYSLDDNSRALLLCLMVYNEGLDPDALRLADIYMRYIHLMQKSDGSFHNEISYEREFLDKKVSEDAFGRTIWALGYLIRSAPADGYFQFARDKFFRAFPHFEHIQSNRGIANAIIGLCHFLNRYPDNEAVMNTLFMMTLKIREHFHDESEGTWRWFEPVLSYDNAIIPLALWHSFQVTKDPDTLFVAKEATDFLIREAYHNGHFSLIGNETWYLKGKRKPMYGQQPLNAMALVMMLHQAFIVTGDTNYKQKMFTAFSWFHGNNDLHVPLYDEESKGCCDGLEKYGVNRNQGAESIISYLLSYLTIKESIHQNKSNLSFKKLLEFQEQ
jgi:glycosyltransferase involved in cell wall biosynthesis